MTMLVYLIPVALFLGGTSLVAFLWALRSGQYDDLDGAAERIFIEDEEPPVSRGDRARAPGPASKRLVGNRFDLNQDVDHQPRFRG